MVFFPLRAGGGAFGEIPLHEVSSRTDAQQQCSPRHLQLQQTFTFRSYTSPAKLTECNFGYGNCLFASNTKRVLKCTGLWSTQKHCSIMMRAINLDTYSLSLLTAKEDVLNPRASANWYSKHDLLVVSRA